MMIMPAAQISDSPLDATLSVMLFWLTLATSSPLVYIVKYSGVCPTALDYKQQTTFQNISQGHGQMKLPDIAEKGMKVMEP